mmetsp:Transcript_46937/g.73289  ORF Transcript_46937/g.73289 Transcript_46937/m.73289 type:complete len:606 (+) Transcript_46937:89-1906(+)
MMATEYEEVDGGWVLLSRSLENKHNRQPSQASMKPLKMGRKMLKYVTKQVKSKTCEPPEVVATCEVSDAHRQVQPELVEEKITRRIRPHPAEPTDCEALRNTCVVPQHFALSPSNSPKTAADFMESVIPLELSELPPPAVEIEDDSDVFTPTCGLGDRAHKAGALECPSGLRRRRASSDPVPSRVAFETTQDSDIEDDMTIVTSAQSMFEKDMKDMEESFVRVSGTPATVARRFAFDNPRVASGCLWLWFVILVIGELGTTIWWTYSIGFSGLLVISAPAALGLSFGLLTFGPEQMIAIAIAVSLAAMPALPAYSAVLLMMPGGSWEGSGSCWDSILQLPILAVICVTFLLSAFVPAVRAERPEQGTLTYVALQSLERAQKIAKAACVLSAWMYIAVVLTSARESVHLSGGAALLEPILTGRGLVLSLHMLGLMCTYGRQRTVAYFGEDLLPRLIGAHAARKLAPQRLVMDHGRRFLKRVPQLRRFSPPMKVVALVVAVRRTAPILFPVLAILPQLAHPDSSRGWPTLALILGLMVVAILAIAAAHEQRTLPRSSLRRLPLLLPHGVTPCTRKLLGYALVAAEGVERTRKGFSSVRTQVKRIISS